jgi:hypothetical protein
LEKHTLSIFRAEVAMLGSGYIYIYIGSGSEEEQAKGKMGQFLLSLTPDPAPLSVTLLGDSLLAQTIFPSFLDSDWPIPHSLLFL